MTKKTRDSAAGAPQWEAPAAGSSKPAKDLAAACKQLLEGGQRQLDSVELRDALLAGIPTDTSIQGGARGQE